MKIKCLIPKRHIIAALLLLINVLGIPSLRAQAIPLRKLDGWWRYTTLQGTLLKSAAQFQTVPAYLTDPALSFPYQRRVNPLQVSRMLKKCFLQMASISCGLLAVGIRMREVKLRTIGAISL
jgi:hypothetical protein